MGRAACRCRAHGWVATFYACGAYHCRNDAGTQYVGRWEPCGRDVSVQEHMLGGECSAPMTYLFTGESLRRVD